MSQLLNNIDDRQLLGINPQDENNIIEYFDYGLSNNEQSIAIDVQILWWINFWYPPIKIYKPMRSSNNMALQTKNN